MKSPVYLHALGMINALGHDLPDIAERLFAGDTSGMQAHGQWHAAGTHSAPVVGAVRLPDHELPSLPDRLKRYDCRNNRFLVAAAEPLRAVLAEHIQRHGATRIGVVIGTSTSGIAEGEAALRSLAASGTLPGHYHYRQQALGAPAQFLAELLGVHGPAYTISTACTSSAKAFGAARRLIDSGVCDAVVTGGADALCALTLGGFGALESLAQGLSRPMSRHRDGINIGEGAMLCLMSRTPGNIVFSGIGDSSDAHHISAPAPDGSGAIDAMRAALRDAGLAPAQIDYVHLHATGTPKNDAMESLATHTCFEHSPWVSGTKPMTGHLLGAAGATGIGICWLTLEAGGRLPPHVWDGATDETLSPLRLTPVGTTLGRAPRHVMTNAYAFGGNNASVILSRAEAWQ
ncbi:3-oxoacyl-[acyl-carrier-protein] synthase 2 [Pandoraea pneumonica]|jgi:3-oxoacyl-[acyl-carrier-protein] synthase-1|uniref:3-oxoacyl-[acyl-carrier-protein] synthase 2 n=1 Tax=Pandoraea pneumonica TaxID=2508299 RepID=A0A5E4RX03_9BURK|nr:beta-ketoacyl-[acyl-carrier-protein] synthase family protein [Pandoraea pneumonica]VVD66368.1 3-oxoacyl-[acyl-carrier-protein] synthase 2 [Pandoraea pneumonica]